MSKELTPLQALEEIISTFYDKDSEEIRVVKVALKRLETLEEEKQSFDRQLEKKLKALKIIKEKKVNVRCLMSGWNLGKYNSYNSHINLTEEEYELLKEIMK